MKFADIKKLQKDELHKKTAELHSELMKLNAQVAIGTVPKNTKQIREIKRALAKINTLQSQSATESVKRLAKKVKYTTL